MAGNKDTVKSGLPLNRVQSYLLRRRLETLLCRFGGSNTSQQDLYFPMIWLPIGHQGVSFDQTSKTGALLFGGIGVSTAHTSGLYHLWLRRRSFHSSSSA